MGRYALAVLVCTTAGPLLSPSQIAWNRAIQHRMALTLFTKQVYKGRRKFTGQITAMKFIMKHGKSEKDIKNLRQEIEILRNLRHENIIQMLDAFETKTDFCVVTELAHGMPTSSLCMLQSILMLSY